MLTITLSNKDFASEMKRPDLLQSLKKRVRNVPVGSDVCKET